MSAFLEHDPHVALASRTLELVGAIAVQITMVAGIHGRHRDDFRYVLTSLSPLLCEAPDAQILSAYRATEHATDRASRALRAVLEIAMGLNKFKRQHLTSERLKRHDVENISAEALHAARVHWAEWLHVYEGEAARQLVAAMWSLLPA